MVVNFKFLRAIIFFFSETDYYRIGNLWAIRSSFSGTVSRFWEGARRKALEI